MASERQSPDRLTLSRYQHAINVGAVVHNSVHASKDLVRSFDVWIDVLAGDPDEPPDLLEQLVHHLFVARDSL